MFDIGLNMPLHHIEKLGLRWRKQFLLECSLYSEGRLYLKQLKIFMESCFASLNVYMQT